MALILAVKEGESVYINDRRVTITDIITPYRFKVEVDGPMPTIYEVRAQDQVEVLPEVFLHAGNTGCMTTVKLAITAPQDKVILRERLYLRAKGVDGVRTKDHAGKAAIR